MKRRRILRLLVFAAALNLLPTAATAQVPQSLVQQGRLLSDDGTPVTSGMEVTFSIYDAATGGSLIWSEAQTITPDETGFYSTVLGGSTNPLDATVFSGGMAYLTLSVDGGAEMSPRHQLTSVPYAQIAGVAQNVPDGSITPAKLASGFSLDSSQVPAPDWGDLTNIPSELSDGDADTLGGLSCNPGQTASWDGTNWICANVLTGNTTTLSSLNCANGQVAKMTTAGWACGADDNTDTNTTYSAGNQLRLVGTRFDVQDGVDSGLNADLLDGQQGSSYLLKSEASSSYLPTSGGTMTGDIQTVNTRVFRDKAGSIGPSGQTTTYTKTTRRLEVVNERRLETVAIPHNQLMELCGDTDGCSVTIGMRNWTNNTTDAAMASVGPMHFDYAPNGRYRLADGFASTGASGIGADGDNSLNHVYNLYRCCYFTDVQHVSGTAQADNSRQMYLLNYTDATFCPNTSNLQCTIIIDD